MTHPNDLAGWSKPVIEKLAKKLILAKDANSSHIHLHGWIFNTKDVEKFLNLRNK